MRNDLRIITERSIKLLGVLCIFIFMFNALFELEVEAGEQTATEVVEDIKVGWNLGNSLNCFSDKENTGFDITSYETIWKNPKTTREMIHTVKKAGFNAIRIPVTYYNHIDANGVIDTFWLARLAEVVQYGLDEGMYVIINIHHDTGYGFNKPIQATPANAEIYLNYIENIWTQVALYFKDYDSRLIFEGMNETLDMTAQNPWYGNGNSWEAMNQLNQTFVNVVRASGGNNSSRNLIVNTYGAQTTFGPVKYFKVPKDSVVNHLIIGVHTFATKQSEINSITWNLFDQFVSKGYPVIISEFGTPCKMKLSERITSAINFINYGSMYGIKCFWWDDGGDYKLLDRSTNKWQYLALVNGMITAADIAEENLSRK